MAYTLMENMNCGKKKGTVTMALDPETTQVLMQGAVSGEHKYLTVLYVVNQKEFFRIKALPDVDPLEKMIEEFLQFSLKTFSEATTNSSLRKMKEETEEIEKKLNKPFRSSAELAEEYVDTFMCLIDSATRAGITVPEFAATFKRKLKINTARTWGKNDDNTYSHL